jgi:hypothetical protein
MFIKTIIGYLPCACQLKLVITFKISRKPEHDAGAKPRCAWVVGLVANRTCKKS